MSHTEIMVNLPTGRATRKADVDLTLIEINCRQHNTDFAPVTEACVGYNKLDVCLEAYLGDCAEDGNGGVHRQYDDTDMTWDMVPRRPRLFARGAIVHLQCNVEGVVKKVRKSDEAGKQCYPYFILNSLRRLIWGAYLI